MASIQEMKDELQTLIDRASDAAHRSETSNLTDALFVAAQTHRLDLVTFLLTVVTILLAIGGLFAFFEIRYRAKIAAQTTAKDECKEIAAEILKDYLNNELPDEIRKHIELIMQEKDGGGGDYGTQDTDQVKS